MKLSVDLGDGSMTFSPSFGVVQRVPTGLEDYPLYQGSYTVTPKDEAQTLETKNCRLADDITVQKIPYYEVSNETGTTVCIGEEL